ncbi:MAG: galactosyldiacylglycerol synthase [Clostridia bacterium]|nr:galactosyldiacylglycerol synthase [Clostridia bacterium]
MKILILSVTAGEGHNSTAKALREEFERQGAECTVLDTFQYISPALAKFLSEGYLLVTEKAKHAYKVGYRLAEKRRGNETATTHLVDMAFAGDIVDFINSDDYGVILFTHPFAGMILDYLKEIDMLSIPTVGILTDFTFHPYWEDCTRNDYVITPADALLLQGLRKGFRHEQILPYGIPIRPDFLASVPGSEARKKLGLDPDKTTILIMGGSMGYGNMAKTVRQIDSITYGADFQMIVVCGNNGEMKAEIDRLNVDGVLRHTVMTTGFVNYVSLLMDAADCIVTKPGGLTTSESLTKGLPMVIVNPIPGQEQRNTEFLLNNGAACAVSKTCSIDECLYQLLSSPTRLDAMRQCVRALSKTGATERVCSFAMELAITPKIVQDQN